MPSGWNTRSKVNVNFVPLSRVRNLGARSSLSETKLIVLTRDSPSNSRRADLFLYCGAGYIALMGNRLWRHKIRAALMAAGLVFALSACSNPTPTHQPGHQPAPKNTKAGPGGANP